MHSGLSKAMAFLVAAAICFVPVGPAFADGDDSGSPSTPIKHLVIIFQENVSFDHYFGTYPNATNPSGEPQFHARPGTPTVNGLQGVLLNNNPNFLNAANGAGASNPGPLTGAHGGPEPRIHGGTVRF